MPSGGGGYSFSGDIGHSVGYLVGVVAGWGLVGIWIAMACDECIRAVVFLFRWKSGAWKNKSFVQPKEKMAPEQA